MALTSTLTGVTGLTWDIPHDRAFLTLFSVVALALLVLGLTAVWVPGVAWSLVVLGAQYWTRLSLDPNDTALWAPLFGVALLLCGEASYLSLELGADSRGPLRGRVLTVVFLALGAATLSEVVVLATALLPLRGFILVIGAAVAVGALFAGLLLLAGRSGSTQSRG